MTQIVPTITATTPTDYAREIEKLNFAPRLHVDITDGELAPSRTVNLNQVYWDENKIIDLHLMMKKPIEWLHQIIALNPNLVILHAESDDAHKNLPRIFEHLRKFNIKCGLALLPETSPENVKDIIEISDYVLIFAGHLGYQDGTADLSQLEKIARIRAINPNVELAWDGGANVENVAEIAQAGIDVINVGAAIAKSENPEKAYQRLNEIANEHLPWKFMPVDSPLKITASLGLISPENQPEKFLMIKNYRRGWDAPGGHIENDETPEQTLRREVREETGAVITNCQEIARASRTEQTGQSVFRGFFREQNFVPSDEASECKLVTKEEFLQMWFGDDGNREVWRELLEKANKT